MVLSRPPRPRSARQCADPTVLEQRAWIEIDLAALTHNIGQLKNWLAPGCKLMAVVKADAYGHGVSAIAPTALAAGASSLAVATSQEGIELRQLGITAPILVLGAVNQAAEIEQLLTFDLQPTLCTPQQALIFSETLSCRSQTLGVQLNIDTGMSRLGTDWQSALSFVQFVDQLPHLHIAGVYSHFATADEPDPHFMKVQHDRFKQMVTQLRAANLCPPCLHIANSAATLSDRTLHYDQARVGLALYGLAPAPHLRDRLSLRPILQVRARITQVKTIAPGTGVSYGHKFVSDRPVKVAVVGIGYADGVPRLLTHKLKVLLRGQKITQIGAITMDQLMIDVSHLENVQPGEVVTLLGQDGEQSIGADDWAEAIGSISWEILCSFKQRLPRIYRS
ncbi:MAG: alanine racemase [Spirulina sp. SIO3F2]|nr:alanine racemase [Spirulina sp. SIO3F2]